MGSVPGSLTNVLRGSVLLVAGVLTDSKDAISLGKQIASGTDASPSDGPREPSPEELAEMQRELERWKQELSKAKAVSPTSDSAQLLAELEKREAELKGIEEKHRQLEEDVWNYPRPGFLDEEAEDCDNCVNIAVVGNSGVGKSLLINSLRGVQTGDRGWAPVGVSQTTTRPVSYSLPGQAGARLWDLAGAGAQQYPPGGYTRAIGLRHFDVVLVVTACRFTQTEAVLLSELEARGMPSFVVRTMVDVDIASNEADHGQSEADTKRGILEDLRGRGVPRPYLVNARRPQEHDFPRLAQDVQAAVGESREPQSQAKRGTARGEESSTARPPKSSGFPKYEVGETAEVWSQHLLLWVKCVIEGACASPNEYDIMVPAAPEDARRIPGVSARALRKALSFEDGESAELLVLHGPQAGSWVRCRVSSAGQLPGSYNVHVPTSRPEKRDLPNVHHSVLRKAAPQAAKPPVVDAKSLKEMMRAFKETCSSKEFKATLDSLQERGMHRAEVQQMKRLFVAHQFNPTFAKHQVPTTKEGWHDFLEFTRSQGHDPELARLAHEVERLLRVQVGDFFGIKAVKGEPVAVQRTWRKRLWELAIRLALQALGRLHAAAQAQAASGAPMARNQGVAAGHVDPMSRSMAPRFTRLL